jgi:FKBP-type peptidyl-prolyl cis-trans isomerase
MKTLTRHLIRGACTGAIVLSASPWAGAQTAVQTPPPAAAPAPATISGDQASYLFGLTFGEQLHSIGISGDLSSEAISRGLKEGLDGKKAAPADRQQLQEYVRATVLAVSQRNLKAAQDFLASNGKKPGVKTTASGLEYKIDKPGNAKAPAIAATDEVEVNYRGTLLDGTEFDSSAAHGKPLNVPAGAGGLIKGWQEALVMMKPGAKWTLYVPPELAYGARPQQAIPANSVLIFDLEIVSVKPGQSATAPTPAPARPAAPPSQQ